MNELSTEILAARKISIRYKRPVFESMQSIFKSKEAETLLRKYAKNKQLDFKEFFWVITLNRASRVLGVSTLAKGSDTGVIISNKEVVQLAVLSNACSVIIAHNHPSGKLGFSKPDIRLTKTVQKCLKIFDIVLLDHLLITSEAYLSMADESLLL